MCYIMRVQNGTGRSRSLSLDNNFTVNNSICAGYVKLKIASDNEK